MNNQKVIFITNLVANGFPVFRIEKILDQRPMERLLILHSEMPRPTAIFFVVWQSEVNQSQCSRTNRVISSQVLSRLLHLPTGQIPRTLLKKDESRSTPANKPHAELALRGSRSGFIRSTAALNWLFSHHNLATQLVFYLFAIGQDESL